MFNRSEAKQELTNWIDRSGKWKYFVGITFKNDLNDLRAKYIFTGLCKKLNQKLFGKRSKKRLPMFPVLEHTKDGRPHFHFMLGESNKMSNSEIKKLILKILDELPNTEIFHLSDKNEWFQIITPRTEKQIIDYCLKSAHKDLDCVLVEHLSFK